MASPFESLVKLGEIAFGGSSAGTVSRSPAAFETTGAAELPDWFCSPAPRAAVGAHVTPATDIRNTANASPRDRRVNLLVLGTDRSAGAAWFPESMLVLPFFFKIPGTCPSSIFRDEGDGPGYMCLDASTVRHPSAADRASAWTSASR